jgi:hypothetical protein
VPPLRLESDDQAQPTQLQADLKTVIDAYIAALGVYPTPGTTAQIKADAEALLALTWPVEHVAKLPGLGYTDLARHADHPEPPSDLLTRHSDSYPESNRLVPGVKMTRTRSQNDSLSLSDPEGISLSGLGSPLGAPASQAGEKDAAAPEGNPASAAAGVPVPREGQADGGQRGELLEMLLGLPGRDRMNRGEVAEMLLPLAVDALAVGWTASKLRGHLARSCDPERVYDPAAVYRKHLKKLPPAPAGVGGHLAAAAPQCAKCNGSGLAEDPETFLPIGPCECRKAPALATVS